MGLELDFLRLNVTVSHWFKIVSTVLVLKVFNGIPLGAVVHSQEHF